LASFTPAGAEILNNNIINNNNCMILVQVSCYMISVMILKLMKMAEDYYGTTAKALGNNEGTYYFMIMIA
jgi:hypothetical protein